MAEIIMSMNKIPDLSVEVRVVSSWSSWRFSFTILHRKIAYWGGNLMEAWKCCGRLLDIMGFILSNMMRLVDEILSCGFCKGCQLGGNLCT